MDEGRKIITGHVYHVFSKSIANFKIFNNEADYSRIVEDKEKAIEIIAYCLMPTHLHLMLKQLKDNAISDFMRKLLNSYSRYFNVKYKRKGTLRVIPSVRFGSAQKRFL
ncbi:MAG: transposase [Candidatus Omnitrophota bacterium]